METGPIKPRVYMLIGPTAVGKSAVALQVARWTGSEILSIDSMQIYRGMDIGTAKPSAAQRAAVPHHLIDIRDPWEGFSTAEYVKAADAAVAEITARGALPLFVGGTALYIKSLLVGMSEGPAADWGLRARLREEAAALGVEALHGRLAAIDPEAARRIHPNDMRRIERALEIYEKTGVAPSALRKEWTSAQWRYDARIVGLTMPREALRARIDRRVDEMIAAGWLDEVRRLLSDGRGLSREAYQALGYAELARVARGEAGLAEAVARIKHKTRRFAKAQMTWFKTFPGVSWIEVAPGGKMDDVIASVIPLFGLTRR